MNFTSRPKLVIYLLTIFCAGLIAGAFWGYSKEKSERLTPPKREDMATGMMNAFKKELSLTEDQVRQIQPIVTETAAQVSEAHRECRRQIGEAFRTSHRRIAIFLSPEQTAALEAWQKRMDEKNRSRKKSSESKPGDKNEKGDKTN